MTWEELDRIWDKALADYKEATAEHKRIRRLVRRESRKLLNAEGAFNSLKIAKYLGVK